MSRRRRKEPRTPRQKVLLGVRVLLAVAGLFMAWAANTSDSDVHIQSDGTKRKPTDEQADKAEQAPKQAEPEHAEKVAATTPTEGDGGDPATS